uniref:Uncharacterized protein n=1 Tax=Anguilla anguilla TaxID=7936 RepID=A0A0E9W0W7_ANGAN
MEYREQQNYVTVQILISLCLCICDDVIPSYEE